MQTDTISYKIIGAKQKNYHGVTSDALWCNIQLRNQSQTAMMCLKTSPRSEINKWCSNIIWTHHFQDTTQHNLFVFLAKYMHDHIMSACENNTQQSTDILHRLCCVVAWMLHVLLCTDM